MPLINWFACRAPPRRGITRLGNFSGNQDNREEVTEAIMARITPHINNGILTLPGDA
ncbi:MAG TPA: hypothetical protein VHZ51_28015 [Ktedonobacteraceae bacterium]|nr:hypothetical protein [Ktedonobacteraceae bacterium]